MKKKVIYKVTTKYSIEIETENIDEEKLIEELNKEFERQLKQDKTYHARTVSLEYLYQNYGFELADTCVDYGVEVLNSDENTIKIAKLTYKYRCLAYVIDSNGYRSREWKDKTHIVLSLDLNTTKSYIL